MEPYDIALIVVSSVGLPILVLLFLKARKRVRAQNEKDREGDRVVRWKKQEEKRKRLLHEGKEWTEMSEEEIPNWVRRAALKNLPKGYDWDVAICSEELQGMYLLTGETFLYHCTIEPSWSEVVDPIHPDGDSVNYLEFWNLRVERKKK